MKEINWQTAADALNEKLVSLGWEKRLGVKPCTLEQKTSKVFWGMRLSGSPGWIERQAPWGETQTTYSPSTSVTINVDGKSFGVVVRHG